MGVNACVCVGLGFVLGISCCQTSAGLVVRARGCVFGSANLNTKSNPNLPPILTTTAFQPQSKAELQDAVKTCSAEPMEMRK